MLRFWRYDDFALDYMLAQQFNYEFQINFEANKRNCKNIALTQDIWLNKYAAVFNITRYDLDFRKYL